MFKVPTLNKNKKKKKITIKIEKRFSMSLNRFELDDVIDLTFIAQLAITCSKLTIETLEKGVIYVQS